MKSRCSLASSEVIRDIDVCMRANEKEQVKRERKERTGHGSALVGPPCMRIGQERFCKYLHHFTIELFQILMSYQSYIYHRIK